jgi:alkanesulfonate monooxygenase SsuD/methylene tetrahydromethanopterin reductase-like flavin-dependent oxidoreductase (luciferase family)
VSEHHASDDGYLPAPLVMAAAIAGRTSTIPISVAALLAPLHDPVRLAEDIAVLDHLSGGRVSYVLGVGYRPAEYESLGRDFARRGRDVEAAVEIMRRAWTGEPFDLDGRTVMVRPRPRSTPHPMLCYGGGSLVAARRAARLDLPFFPQVRSEPVVAEYQQERARLGLEPGLTFGPGTGPLNVFVADDPDATWARIGEHLLHDARSYARWQLDAGIDSAALDTAETVAALRAGTTYAVLTPDEAIDCARTHGSLALHPLCGGIPPAVAWESLQLLADAVFPRLRDAQRNSGTSAP